MLLPAAATLLLLSGCATTEVAKGPTASPAPTAPTAPAAPAAPTAPAKSPSTPSPAPPPAVSTTPRPGAPAPAGPLRPEVPAVEEQRLLESTRQSIGDVTRIVAELEGRPMKPPQQETLRTAKNFLDQARTALDQRDYQRAANLASKARALTDDLAGATK
jgi:hypothetical protein